MPCSSEHCPAACAPCDNEPRPRLTADARSDRHSLTRLALLAFHRQTHRLVWGIFYVSEAARKGIGYGTHIQKFFTEAHRQSYDQGKAEGEAEGEAKALIEILKRRGMAVTDEQQRQIAACTDLATLDRWLDRAFSVTAVDELFA